MRTDRMARRVPGQKILIVPVFENFTSSTNGDNVAWTYTDFPEHVQQMIEELGPYCTSITAHTLTVNRSAAHSWKTAFYPSVDGKTLPANPTDLFGAITGNGQAVQTAYSTASGLMIHMRHVLATKNTTGTVVETAGITLILVFEFKT